MDRKPLFRRIAPFLVLSLVITACGDLQNPIATPTSTATPLLYRRLATGTYIAGSEFSCEECNKLTVVNGEIDSVVVLQGLPFFVGEGQIVSTPISTRPTIPISPLGSSITLAVYIRAGDSITFKGVAGSLRLCFTQGEDWDSSIGRFTRNASYTCFKDPFPFAIGPVPSIKVTGRHVVAKYIFADFSVTLYPEQGGIYQIVPLSLDSFPALGQ